MIPSLRRLVLAPLFIGGFIAHFAAAANDQNFDAISTGNTGTTSFIAGSFTFTKNGSGTIGVFGSGVSSFLSTTGSDHILVYDGNTQLGVTQNEFSTTDGSEFQMIGLSIDSGFGVTTYTIRGFRDGSQVNTATLDIQSSSSNGGVTYTQVGGAPGQGTLSFSGWDNIDRVVFTGADLDTMLDDIDVGPAVVPAPAITSATYNANTGVLAVTGTNMTTGDTIAVNKLTLTGEGGSTYLLTTINVTASSATAFSVTLNATDKAAVNLIFNKNGTSSTSGTTYNLSAADDWDANVTSGNTADTTNGITVSNVATPAITSATYDAATGTLVVTGTGFLKLSGLNNDIDVSKLSISGDSTTYTLTTASVEITNGTSFSVVLNGADVSALTSRINQNGTTSAGAVTYNLAAAEDWATGAAAAVVVADLTGNGITASNVTNPPSVTTSGGTTAFTEGNNVTSTPVAIDSGLTVSDLDSSTLASGTVSITGNFQSAQDLLAFTNNPATMGNISGSYNSGTGVLTLTSSGATATLAQWQAALRSVTYTNSSETPTTSTRTISFLVDDGALSSSTGTKSVSVASVNDTPIATASGGTTAFTEGNNVTSTPVVIDSGLTVSDLDSTTFASGTVSITGNFQSGEDVLAFTNNPATMGNITGSYTAGTGILALTSAGATATLAQWQAALRSVTYTDSSDTPNTASRTISFVVNDGSTSSSATTKTVSVSAVDDSPAALTSGGTTAFTEGSNVTSTPVAIDSGLLVDDPDTTTLASGTVSITGNFQSGEDVLAFTNNPATMGNISGSYDSGTGILTLTSAGATATLAQWQAALRSITYTNTSDTPQTASRTVSFTLNDGNSSGSAGTKAVSVTSANDSPIATASGGTTAFTEGNGVTSTPVAIDIGLNVSDVDSTTFASATVSITGNFQSAEDVLGFTNNPATMGNISAVYNAGTGVLTLTSAGATATLAQWQAALRSVTYTDSSDTPNTASRTISFVVNDGSTSSSATTKTVSVASVNDSPDALTSGGTTTFTEGNSVTSTPVVVDSGLLVADPDSGTLASGTVAITGNFQSGEDVLAFTNNPATMGNISGSYNSGTGILTLTSAGATATTAQWQAALRSITYSNTSDLPNTASRTISFTLNDGTSIGPAGTKLVAVTPADDTPVATASGGTTAFTEGNNVVSTPVVIDSGLTVSDVDSTTFASATVSITGNFQSAEDALAFTNNPGTMGNVSGVYNAGSGVLTLTSAGATATLAQWQIALRAVTYTNSSDTPNTTSRTISFTVNDGSTASSATTKTVSVASTNDDPTNLLLSASGVNQGAGVNAVVGTLSSVDPDSVSFTYSLVAGAGSTNNASFNISGASLRANDPSLLPEGPYSVRIRTTDNLGGTFEKVFSITVVDNVPPAAPSTPDLAAGSDAGTSSTDDLTNITTPTFTGTAEANSTVELFRAGTVSLGTTTANGSGNWSLTLGTPLSAGIHSITAKATDAGANTSVASSALSITVDTTAPALPVFTAISSDTGTSASDQITSDPTLILSGTAEANSVVTVTLVSVGAIGTATANGSGNWSFDYTATTLSAGDHIFRATAADAAGNSSGVSADFLVTIDAAAPSQVTISSISTDTGSSATDGITTDQTLTFSGTAEANATVTLNRTGLGSLGTAVANGSGNWSFNYTGTTLPAGSYIFTATATDSAGNISTVSAAFPVTIDLTAPAAPAFTAISTDNGTSSTDQITSDQTLILSGTTEANASVTITRVGTGVIGTATANGTGLWSFDYTATTLPIGTHLFNATATDLAGNVGPASGNFTVMVQAAPGISSQPVGGTFTVGTALSLSVVASGTGPFTYQWYLDGVALTDGAGRSGSTGATFTESSVSTTSAGSYTVVVSNLSGSITSASAVVVVNKLSQTITFPQPGAGTVGVRMLVSATASSGLPVSFTVISGSGTFVTTNQFVPQQAGAIVVRASQAGDATYSAATDVDRTINAVIAAPQVTTQPVGGTVGEGGSFTLSVVASGSGLSYQWTFNGVAIPGANQASLVLNSAAQSQQGSYAVIVTNSTGSVTSTAVDVVVQIDNRLFNLSSRLQAGTGSRTFISGFVISGNVSKSVVIRGVGPGLTQFGVPGVIAHPSLQLFNIAGAKIAEAAEWGKQSNAAALSDAMSRLGMFTLNTLDSAMLVSLPPGNYTALMAGLNGETGVSLVEIYDASPTSGRLINISTRGEVGRGADVLIAGFIISGASPKKVLIRAIGPGLNPYGVTGTLVNPALRLFNLAGTKIAENDDWEEVGGGAEVAAANAATGAFPLVHLMKDSAIVVTLPPGAYTAHGYGKDDGTGVALVEVYEVP